MNLNTQNIAMFVAALQDCFKEDEDREMDTFPKINLEEFSGSELIYEMFTALTLLFNNLSDGKYDVLEFLCILNHMAFQDALEQAKEEITHATPESNE